jgi:predicted MFS family arabinose efflux permease
MVALGLIVTALASGLGALAQGAATILISRFFEGFGFIVTVVAGPGLIALAAQSRHHKLAFALWGSYMPAGTAAMMLAAPAIMVVSGWRGLWLVNAALLLGFAALLWRLTRAEAAAPADAPALPPRQAIALTLRAPAPWLLALGFACYTSQFISVMGFLPVMLVESRGFDPATAAALVALAVAANVPGNLLGGFLLHRNWPRWLLIVSASVAMGLSALGIYDDRVPDEWRFALVLVFSLLGGLLPTSVLGAAPVFAPRPALVGTTAGLIMQGSNLGQTVGPPAVAALVSASGSWSSAPIWLCSAAAMACAFAIAIGREERRQKA